MTHSLSASEVMDASSIQLEVAQAWCTINIINVENCDKKESQFNIAPKKHCQDLKIPLEQFIHQSNVR
jgi:hypothetical protein